MAKVLTLYALVAPLLVLALSAHAETCTHAIQRVQARLDAAIERRAGSGDWNPESLNALRGHQPTPHSIASTEGNRGRQFEVALAALDRARAANHSGYSRPAAGKLRAHGWPYDDSNTSPHIQSSPTSCRPAPTSALSEYRVSASSKVLSENSLLSAAHAGTTSFQDLQSRAIQFCGPPERLHDIDLVDRPD